MGTLLLICSISQSSQQDHVGVVGNYLDTAIGKRKVANAHVPTAERVVGICLEFWSRRYGEFLPDDRCDRGQMGTIKNWTIDWWNAELIGTDVSLAYQKCATKSIGYVSNRYSIEPVYR